MISPQLTKKKEQFAEDKVLTLDPQLQKYKDALIDRGLSAVIES